MNIQNFVESNFHVATATATIGEAGVKLVNDLSTVLSDITPMDDNTVRLTYNDSSVSYVKAYQLIPLLTSATVNNEFFRNGGLNKNFKQVGYVATASNSVKTIVKATKQALTSGSQIVVDIKNGFDTFITGLIESRDTVLKSDDLLDSYYNIVKDGKELVIDGVTINANATKALIATEDFKDIILTVESIFNTFNGVYIDTVLDGNNLEVEVDGYTKEHKETITNSLKASGFKVAKVVELLKHNKGYFSVVLK
jgi:hypothetical protein